MAEEPASPAPESEERFPDLEPLAQVHGTYIVAQAEDGFYLIDQHAAHERIYYERFPAEMRREEPKGQPLLMPFRWSARRGMRKGCRPGSPSFEKWAGSWSPSAEARS